MDTTDLPIASEKLVRLNNKILRASERGRGIQLSAEEVDIMTALGAAEVVALAVARQLRALAIARIYKRAGLPLPGNQPAGEPSPRSDAEPKPVQDRPYTPAALSERWGVSTANVLNRIKRGELAAFMIGPRSYRVRPEVVAEYEAKMG